MITAGLHADSVKDGGTTVTLVVAACQEQEGDIDTRRRLVVVATQHLLRQGVETAGREEVLRLGETQGCHVLVQGHIVDDRSNGQALIKGPQLVKVQCKGRVVDLKASIGRDTVLEE